MKTTQLKPGDILQAGDYIERIAPYQKHRGPLHEHRDTHPHPIALHTIGRTILSADLVAARYFRP